MGGFTAWEIWGTGLHTDRAQERLGQSLDARINTSSPGSPAAITAHFRRGDAVARLRIPRIDLNMIVVEGTDPAALKNGPGHYEGTAYPWEDHGRVAIAGHRTTYGNPFWSLDRVREGDLIELATEYGTFRYRVARSFEIVPSNGTVLDQTREPTLVLTTCTPRFSAARRLVVAAVRL